MRKLVALVALALASTPAQAEVSFGSIVTKAKPQEIPLPPERYRGHVEGQANVIFQPDPRASMGGSCRQNPGYITLACTLGKPGNTRISILPLPIYFSDREKFAKALMVAFAVDKMQDNTWASQMVYAHSCDKKYQFEILARLTCHEVIGHQLGNWPEDHPKH